MRLIVNTRQTLFCLPDVKQPPYNESNEIALQSDLRSTE